MISDVFKKPKNYSIVPYTLNPIDIDHINCPLRNILRVENCNQLLFFVRSIIKEVITNVIIKSDISETEACASTFINFSFCIEIYCDSLNFVSTEEKQFYQNSVSLSNDEIVTLCVETFEQRKSTKWHEARKFRISASSKAHKIKSITKKKNCDLVKEFINCGNNKVTKSMKYGLKNELKAINEYCDKYKCIVKRVGLFVKPEQPWICASPDGVVVQDDVIVKILGVKYPSSCTNKPVYDELSKKFNVPYIFMKDDINYLLESHQY